MVKCDTEQLNAVAVEAAVDATTFSRSSVKGFRPSITSGRQRFLAACASKPVDRPPMWLMRQAGRCLPEYRALKEKYSFLQLVQTPSLAAEVTLQPVRRFGFDAAILFSDILVVAEALGQGYHFRETGGIQMDFPLASAREIHALQVERVAERLQYQADALLEIKRGLKNHTALLGFAGSPWTLANFMLEGGSAKKYLKAEALLLSDPELFSDLMSKLTQAVTESLRLQIEAGVDAIQIFDSLGGNLSPEVYDAASGRWIRTIIGSLGSRVPVIVFSRGTNRLWRELLKTSPQVLGTDWTVSLPALKESLPVGVAVQGNLDPAVLLTDPARVATETARLLESMRGSDGYIFNLGHGVPPNAKLENLESLVTTVKNFK